MSSNNKLLQRLTQKGDGFNGLVLDGGMGTELKLQGVFKNLNEYTTLWSAAALLHEEGRQAVKQAHRDYIDAGAQLLITNTYACTAEILGKAGIEHRQEELIGHACRLAQEAIAESGKACLIAGSMPPLSVSYRPDLVADDALLKAGYEKIATILEKNGVDLFMCETMTCIKEAAAAVSASRACSSKPVFVAVTLDKPVKAGMKRRRSERAAPSTVSQNLTSVLRSGEPLSELAAQLNEQVNGFLINCCSPEAATLGLQQLLEATRHQKPCGVYANHFEPIPRDWKLDAGGDGSGGLLTIRSDLSPVEYAKYAQMWANMGASMIGGCCGISPEHIRVLTETINSRPGAKTVKTATAATDATDATIDKDDHTAKRRSGCNSPGLEGKSPDLVADLDGGAAIEAQ
jgi:S-methylmethionine-dependent homocysteine/selenocysteine methylase